MQDETQPASPESPDPTELLGAKRSVVPRSSGRDKPAELSRQGYKPGQLRSERIKETAVYCVFWNVAAVSVSPGYLGGDVLVVWNKNNQTASSQGDD